LRVAVAAVVVAFVVILVHTFTASAITDSNTAAFFGDIGAGDSCLSVEAFMCDQSSNREQVQCSDIIPAGVHGWLLRVIFSLFNLLTLTTLPLYFCEITLRCL
jgi:hypothetical protein